MGKSTLYRLGPPTIPIIMLNLFCFNFSKKVLLLENRKNAKSFGLETLKEQGQEPFA